MNTYNEIVEIYLHSKKKIFKDKLTTFLIDESIPLNDINKLVMYFGFLKKRDILKIIINLHPKPDSINLKQFVQLKYFSGLMLVLKKVPIHEQYLVDVAMTGDINFVKMVIENKEVMTLKYVLEVMHFCDKIDIRILKLIFSIPLNDVYFSVLFTVLKKRNIELADHLIKNFSNYGTCDHYNYIYCIYQCLLDFGDYGRHKIVYENLGKFFTGVDYSGIVRAAIQHEREKMLKLILLNEPTYISYALEYLKEWPYSNVGTWEIVFAFSCPNKFEKPNAPMKHGAITFLKKFNENPQEMNRNLRWKHKIYTPQSMIFALTIFLCDGLLKN